MGKAKPRVIVRRPRRNRSSMSMEEDTQQASSSSFSSSSPPSSLVSSTPLLSHDPDDDVENDDSIDSDGDETSPRGTAPASKSRLHTEQHFRGQTIRRVQTQTGDGLLSSSPRSLSLSSSSNLESNRALNEDMASRDEGAMKKEESTTAEETDMSTFRSLGVCEEICEAIERIGWTKPTPIQVEALPVALQGKDLIGLAQTGSGKTAAFAIPVLQSLLQNPQPLFAVVLVPTRELAFQIQEQFTGLGATIGVRCGIVVGGVDMMTQAIQLAKKPHIVIATPGRLVDHLENTKGFSLRNTKYLILDEADKMLSMDFEDDINKVLAILPRARRTYLFSATMTSQVSKLERASLSDPVKVEVSTKFSTVDNLIQNLVLVPAKRKETYLSLILTEFAGSSMIIFTGTCATSQRLSLMLRNLGFDAIPLHGQMSQPNRLGALNKFRAGVRSILIATDVASRGLDIPLVDLVINYDMPTNAKDYVHRVGRTARAGRAGRALTFVTQYDVELYQKIERVLRKKLDPYPVDEAHLAILEERVNDAKRLAAVEMRDFANGKRSSSRSDSGRDRESGPGQKRRKIRSKGHR